MFISNLIKLSLVLLYSIGTSQALPTASPFMVVELRGHDSNDQNHKKVFIKLRADKGHYFLESYDVALDFVTFSTDDGKEEVLRTMTVQFTADDQLMYLDFDPDPKQFRLTYFCNSGPSNCYHWKWVGRKTFLE